MNGAISNVLVVVVVYVGRAKADAGQARIHIEEPVVMIGHMEVAGILGPVGVRMPDQRDLEVVMELVPRYCDKVGGMCNVEQPIVKILAMVLVGEQVIMIDPDMVRVLLDVNGIPGGIGGQDKGNAQIANDHIAHTDQVQTDAHQRGGRAQANDRGVGTDHHIDVSGDGAADLDDLGRGAADSTLQS